ncbi:L-rhamnose mutarotase [Sphingobium sp.]|uniref:L-rhamnose mutarotase n=1 Tax=Sphingobium sp. TaxID=1912891 RepID=UPI00262AB079|nr:L-rhamnose mutarotase [Sphingobium sp.]
MTIHAFKMQLKPGVVEEYRRRHDEIWPELSALLSESGIHDYSIFLDEDTLSLFAVLKLRSDNSRDALPDHPVMKRWWDYMAPLMEVQPGNQPREWPLPLLFHMD